jgi:branched-chain amino acid transport system substrate-binding protein
LGIRTRTRWNAWAGTLAAGVLLLVACNDTVETTDDASARDEAAIPIAFVGELTGDFAVWGVPARNGMRLAVADINAEGGVAGRPLELLERDTQGTPEEAVTLLRGLIDRQGIVAAGGIISSDVGLSAARVAEEDEVPLLLVKAGSERILTEDTRYVFRTCLPAAPMNMQPLAEYIEAEGLTRIGAIVADYAWGRSIEASMQETIGALDVELQIEVAPVPETDFTTYLRRLGDLDPELLIATGHPPGSGPIARQAAELGLGGAVVGPYAASSSVMEGVGDLAYDRYLDLACADVERDDYRELAARYHTEFGDFMENDAVAGYGLVQMIAQAIEATGSDDPVGIAAYLHDTTFELPGYAFDVSFTAWGELASAQPLLTVLREQDPPEGVNPGAPWYPEVVFRSEVLEPFDPAAS